MALYLAKTAILYVADGESSKSSSVRIAHQNLSQ